MEKGLKVLSYNIHKGLNWGSGKVVIKQIKSAIKNSKADIVFLQEIVGEHKLFEKKYSHWPKGHQLEYLADEIWSEYAYAKNAVFNHGHYGNAILSKYPIIQWSQQNISTNRFEQRGILHCTIDVGGDYQLHAYCLHLDLTHTGRKKQYKIIEDRILQDVKNSDPVIVAGDFNDWNKQGHVTFEKKLNMFEVFKDLYGDYAKTFPAKFPLLKLDRIYTKNLKIEHGEICENLPWKNLSDHLPLLATLSF
jgi:endonuclease/exonuclease/phosphatase family metal-dependent hydrolase